MDWITPTGFAWFVGALVVLRGLAEWMLDRLNLAHLQKHRGKRPEGWDAIMSESEYARALDYTEVKNRFGQWNGWYGVLVLLIFLFSGLLPVMEKQWSDLLGSSLWMQSGFLLFALMLYSLLDLPWNYYSQFHIEERFGFNKSNVKLWLVDQVKMVFLAVVIGWPLLTLLLWIVARTGTLWWVWAWGVILVFQLVMMILAPMLILPLFNKLSPLADGPLKNRLYQLADRTGFGMQSIQVMDGSRRSGHSNAFFTGFGSFRRIVLFDTLMDQLEHPEIEGVLAHEIGHYQKKHVVLMMTVGLVGMLIQLGILAWVAGQIWFFEAFGFSEPSIPIAFLLFVMIFGTITFWVSPLGHLLSRRFEYEADAYAVEATGDRSAFVSALRKINQENLSNPVPHPLYSFVYYSHPTLTEREGALSLLKPQKA